MNTRVERVLGIVLVFFAAIVAIDLARAAADHPRNSGASEDEAAIKQVVAGFSDGWNSHDAHAMCLSLADDVQWVSWRGEASHSRKQVEDDHAALFAGLYKNSHRTDTVKAGNPSRGTVKSVGPAAADGSCGRATAPNAVAKRPRSSGAENSIVSRSMRKSRPRAANVRSASLT